MPKTECGRCGIAFDVGRRSCIEIGCRGSRAKSPATKANPIVSRFMSAKQRAKKKGLPFNLTIDFVGETINSPCDYCGSHSPSELDRKDSSKGYTVDNVVPACRRCNTIKNNVVTYEEMFFIAGYLGWRS